MTSVRIVEVGPRDGLQNEAQHIPTAIKISLIDQLSKTGLKTIEATSFVSAKWVPQLSDAEAVLQGINKNPEVHYPVLVPNQQGMLSALGSGVTDVAVFTAASNTFSQKNTHSSIEESFQRIEKIMPLAKEHQIPVRAYLSCVIGCPYEGKTPLKNVLRYASRLIEMGCYEVSMGDTIGVGTPGEIKTLLKALEQELPLSKIAVHFHDTYGQALANIYVSLEAGIRVIDSSVAGLGGCPYAPGSSGNVATEEVIYMLNGLNMHTGIDLEAVIKVSHFISEFLKRPPRSKVALAKMPMLLPF